VVKGISQEEAELKAELQMTIWNERWAARQDRFEKAANLKGGKYTANNRTKELQGQINDLETLLKICLEQTSFSWNDLKDNTIFRANPPIKPVNPKLPVKPNENEFVPQLTFLDRIFSGRRRKKEMRAGSEFESARIKWSDVCSTIDAEYQMEVESYMKKFAESEDEKKQHKARITEQHLQIDKLRSQYISGDTTAVEYYCAEVLNHSTYPESFPQSSSISFDPSNGVLIVDFELPNLSALPSIKEVKYIATCEQFQEVPVSDTWLRRTYDDVLYQTALRTLHELFIADESAILKSIVFNGWVHSIDKATGAETHGCILSVEAAREEFLQINLSQVEPKACFRKLKGVASSKLSELTPIRPILTINKQDHRFIDAYDVTGTLDERTNLAAMDWVDFENLIREIFEKEFSKNGGEVKITQASRDGGVDAIAFDPDPIRGGKIIIQAKRYTNVVGVSAVRDLFGTVHNEGANKGILVTTSTYGPDAYEFIKGKPLTLISGSELLFLLASHGHRAKIDLQEAKAQCKAENNSNSSVGR